LEQTVRFPTVVYLNYTVQMVSAFIFTGKSNSVKFYFKSQTHSQKELSQRSFLQL